MQHCTVHYSVHCTMIMEIQVTLNTFVFVSKAPRPQNVPPPIELPPILSKLSSDSTCWEWEQNQNPAFVKQRTTRTYCNCSLSCMTLKLGGMSTAEITLVTRFYQRQWAGTDGLKRSCIWTLSFHHSIILMRLGTHPNVSGINAIILLLQNCL